MKINDIDDNSDKIEYYVKQYINTPLYKNGFVMYRGQNIKKENVLYNVPNDGLRNTPLDTGIDCHILVNKLAKEKFNYKIRNGVFSSFNYARTKMYGDTHVIIPVSDFKIFTRPYISDFTGAVYMNIVSNSNYNIWYENKYNKVPENKDKYEEYKLEIIQEYIDGVIELDTNTLPPSDNYYGELMVFGKMYIIPLKQFERILLKVTS